MNPQFSTFLVVATCLVLGACQGGTSRNLSSTLPATPIAQSSDVRVMSYNIRYNTSEDGESAWPNRRDELASQIRFNRPDLGGLQEVLVDQLRDLQQRLPEYTFIGVGRDDGAEAGEFSPVFFDSQRFVMLNGGTFWLSETPDQAGSVGWDAALPRIVTWVELADQISGHNLLLFNTHFDHQGQSAREHSAVLIRQRIAEIAPHNALFMVTGDFNVTPDNAAYAAMTQGNDPIAVDDALLKSLTPHHGPTETYFGFEVSCSSNWPEVIDNLLPQQSAPRRIDYIFLATDIAVLRHATLTDSRDGRYLSDHQAVLADLILP